MQLFLDGVLLCAFKTFFSKFSRVNMHCFLNQRSGSLHNQKLIGSLLFPTFQGPVWVPAGVYKITVKASQFSHLMNWTAGCRWPKLWQSEPFPGIRWPERLKRQSLKCSPVMGSGIPTLCSFTRWKSQTREERMRPECREEREHRRRENPGDIPLILGLHTCCPPLSYISLA